MKITIQTTGFMPSGSLASFIQKSLGKLEAYQKNIIESRVCLRTDSFDTKEDKLCVIKLSARGRDIFAFRQSNSFEEAMQLAVDALKYRIEKDEQKML